MAMTKTVSRRRTQRQIADGGMPKGTRSRCLTVKKSVRVTKTSKLFDWPGRVPLSASRDLLPNHKIECAFLLLIIFLSSSSLFICHTGLSSCYADVHCMRCVFDRFSTCSDGCRRRTVYQRRSIKRLLRLYYHR